MRYLVMLKSFCSFIGKGQILVNGGEGDLRMNLSQSIFPKKYMTEKDDQIWMTDVPE